MFLQVQVWALLMLQESSSAISFDPLRMWGNMTLMGKGIVSVLFIMSAWSIGVMIDRVLAFNAARKQSRQFAPAVAGALREGKLEEAIKIADKYRKSHLAKVVVAGLQEFNAHQASSEISGDEIEASKRALDRSEAIVHAELKRGISSLATIGSTAKLSRPALATCPDCTAASSGKLCIIGIATSATPSRSKPEHSASRNEL